MKKHFALGAFHNRKSQVSHILYSLVSLLLIDDIARGFPSRATNFSVRLAWKSKVIFRCGSFAVDNFTITIHMINIYAIVGEGDCWLNGPFTTVTSQANSGSRDRRIAGRELTGFFRRAFSHIPNIYDGSEWRWYNPVWETLTQSIRDPLWTSTAAFALWGLVFAAGSSLASKLRGNAVIYRWYA